MGHRSDITPPPTQAAMVDQGSRAAMADPGFPWAMAGSPPPKKNYWRSPHYSGGRSEGAGTWGRSGSADSRGHSGSGGL